MDYEQAMQDERERQRRHYSPEFKEDQDEPVMDWGNVADDWHDEQGI